MNLKALIGEYNKSRGPVVGRSVCHAADVSLNFEQNGNATACCFSRQIILGTYPRQSIDEIWNGPRANEFRRILANNELREGCKICREQIEARNFAGLHARHFDRHYVGPDALNQPLVPRMMEFELSNACNLECVMCNGFFSSSIRKNREHLEPKRSPYDDAFVDQLRPFMKDLREAKFLGGEPFLNPLYFKIWNMIIEENPSIHVIITTNGTIVTEQAKSIIERLKPSFVVSCESLNPQRYEAIRVNASFKIFQDNMNFYLEQRQRNNTFMTIAVCPMQQNWMDLPELLNYCNANRMDLGLNTVVWPLKYSIKAMKRSEIQNIRASLADDFQSAAASAATEVARRNVSLFSGFLTQLEYWAQEAST